MKYSHDNTRRRGWLKRQERVKDRDVHAREFQIQSMDVRGNVFALVLFESKPERCQPPATASD